jgi:hypothetical protein
MPVKQEPLWLAEEVARFLAKCPTQEEFLEYRPSARAAKRLAALIAKVKRGKITDDEQWELNQFEYLESVMQLVKAHLRPKKAARP